MITVAPGIAAPEESETAPAIDPPTTWACDGSSVNTSAARMPAAAGQAMGRIALISRPRGENDAGEEERFQLK
jgi:hypothetical protein